MIKCPKIVALALGLSLLLSIPGIQEHKTYAAQGNNQVVATKATVTQEQLLKDIRVGNSNTKLRLVLDLTKATEYTVTKENNNTRLVVNLFGVKTKLTAAPKLQDNTIKNLILGQYGNDVVQLIVDMQAPLNTKVSVLTQPDRLVIDIQKEYESEVTSQVADGLQYTKYIKVDGRGMQTSYVLQVDMNKYAMDLALAGNSVAAGRGTVSNIAKTQQAVVAINGGYFDTDGTLLGNTRINGVTAGTTYFRRTALGLFSGGKMKLAPSEYYSEVKIGKKKAYLAGVNCPRGENTLIMYNKLFGSNTGTNQYGQEYVIRNRRVVAINQQNSAIPQDGMVLSAHGLAQEDFKDVKVGDTIEVGESFGQELDAATDIIGAGPELLRDGELHVTAQEEEFPNDIAKGRAPRTALGWQKDGKLVLLVVDGRQDHSIGATLTETAELLQKYGAVQGYNLDGGGSSAMVIQGKLVNRPSDSSERRVGSGIVLHNK